MSNTSVKVNFNYRLTEIGCLCFYLDLIIWLTGLGGRDLHLLFGISGTCCLAYVLYRWEIGDTQFRNAILASTTFLRLTSLKAFVSITVVLFGAIWLTVYISKYYSIGLNNFDAGIFSNIVYNTANGNPFYSSIQQRNHLGEHFSPIIAIFTPFYLIFPTIHWILMAQVLSYAIMPYLLFLISTHVISDTRIRHGIVLTISVAWFLYAPMEKAIDFPFHASTLAAPWILLAFLFLHQEKMLPMWLVLTFLLVFKENMGFVWMGFGLYLCFAKRQFSRGIILFLIGTAAIVITIQVIIPYFGQEPWPHLSRFGPWDFLPEKFEYLLKLLSPLAFLPLIFWRFGLLALPAMSQNLVSKFPPMFSVSHHYDDVVAPLLFAALVPIAARLWKDWLALLPIRHRAVWILAIAILIISQAAESPFRKLRKTIPTIETHNTIREAYRLNHEFPNSFLYVQNSLGPYFYRFHQTQFPLFSKNCAGEAYKKHSLIILSKHANSWGINNFDQCLESLRSSPNKFRQLRGYRWLTVWQVH